MTLPALPQHYQALKERFPDVLAAVEALGAATHASGPLDEGTTHLVQIAAAIDRDPI